MAVHAYPRDLGSDYSIRVLNWRNLLRIDWLMTICVIALTAFGMSTLYSAGQSTTQPIFFNQMLAVGPGILLVLFIVATDHRFLVSLAPLMYAGALGLLVLVHFYGYEAKGSERWLDLGIIRVQPSEIAKLMMVYTLTWYFVALGERIRRFHWFLLTFVLAGVPIGLILAQPNLGTAASLVPLVLVMLFVAGCKLWHLGLVIMVGLSLLPVLWLEMKDFHPQAAPFGAEAEPGQQVNPESILGLRQYQRTRIYSFLHPEYDPQGSGWHTYQSKITVGSGGLSGKGFMEGTQTRLNYLPEHHTDFIFSLLAEERGFIGVAIVLGLFAAFFLRGLMFARDCPEMSGTLLATGIVAILFFHVFVNIAITVGLMPVTGIPLPFLSYGRSFFLTTLLCVGVLLNVPMRNRVFVNR